jgi:CheY-like chemotaxis protein
VNAGLDPLRERFRERAARDLELFRRHLADDDLGAAAVETTAHKLAGSAGIFGFAEIGEAAREVDRTIASGSRPSRQMLETLVDRLAAAAPARPDSGAAPVATLAGGGETILIVEDDHLLRAHAERALRGLGYQVVCAAGADEALAGLAGLPPIQLLFTDLMMPGAVGGEALAQEIRRARPDVRVLFTSGKTAGADELAAGHFLAKPYRRETLAATVRKVLDQPVKDPLGGGS